MKRWCFVPAVGLREAFFRCAKKAASRPTVSVTLDSAGRISEMRDRAFAEAREQLPELRRHFFGAPADEFVPFHRTALIVWPLVQGVCGATPKQEGPPHRQPPSRRVMAHIRR
jgi:hypothetical protein